MANARFRQENFFAAFSGIGKKQTAFGTYLANADIDTRDKCTVEVRKILQRSDERDCGDRYLIEQPIRRRSHEVRFTYDRVTAQIAARWLAYFFGVAAAPTGTPANEVKTLTRSGTVSGGTFTVSITLEGRTGVSAPIAFDVTAAQLQTALTNPASTLGRIIKNGDVSVSGDWTAGMVCTFGGRLANADLPVFTIDNALITGGGTVVSTETTPGANKYHAITATSDGSKPLFSFALGDELGSIATDKYGDAVVGQIDINTSAESDSVQLVATVPCNYIVSEEASFSVPACVVPTALRPYDCRLSINGTYETRDLWTHTANLNDNVPIEAAYAYDDIDLSLALQRGRQPSYELAAEIYGQKEAATYQLALNELTQAPVNWTKHYGHPGNRVSIIGANTKIKPQDTSDGFAGPLSESIFRINGTPFGTSGAPLHVDAYLAQTTAFLTS